MKKIIAFLFLLILTSLACTLPSRAGSTVEATATPIPVSTEAAGEVENQLATAAAELSTTGQVSVSFTETQLTSFISQRLAAEENSPIKDPQVKLRDGVIEVTGNATIGILTAPISLILEPYTDQGNLGVNISEAKFGSVPLPQATLDSLSQTLNQNLNELITVQGEKFYLETIAINDGTLALSGHRP